MLLTLPENLEARLSPQSTALHLAIGLFVSDEATLGQAAKSPVFRSRSSCAKSANAGFPSTTGARNWRLTCRLWTFSPRDDRSFLDTSPLTALLTVGEEQLLPQLSTEVIIPSAVQTELLPNHARLPVWLRVAQAQDTAQAENTLGSLTRAKPRPLNWLANSAPTGCLLKSGKAANSPHRKTWR
jgi:hypothetical protein